MSKNTKSGRVGGDRSTAVEVGRVIAAAEAEAAAIIAHATAEAEAAAIIASARAEAEEIRHVADRPRATALGDGRDAAPGGLARVHERAEAIERELAELRVRCEALSVELGRFRDEPRTTVGPTSADRRAGAPADLGPPGDHGPAQAPEPRAAARGPEATARTNGGQPRPTQASAVAPGPPVEIDLIRTARLIALPMAVAGNSRADVERHLRESLGLEDPTAVLDHVFGAPTSPA